MHAYTHTENVLNFLIPSPPALLAFDMKTFFFRYFQECKNLFSCKSWLLLLMPAMVPGWLSSWMNDKYSQQITFSKNRPPQMMFSFNSHFHTPWKMEKKKSNLFERLTAANLSQAMWLHKNEEKSRVLQNALVLPHLFIGFI